MIHFIIEGPDNSGKTTLAKRIAELAGNGFVQYFHPGGPPADLHGEQLCLAQQSERLASLDTQYIMDRCTAISQQVYNPDVELDVIRTSALYDLLRPNVVLIYCRPSTDKLLRAQDLTWRDDETEEHKQKIVSNLHTFVQRYDEIMMYAPHVTYSYDESMTSFLIEKAVSALRGSQESCQWFVDIMQRSK